MPPLQAVQSSAVGLAGVWDSRGEGEVARDATNLVASGSGFPDMSGKLTPADFKLLLADSIDLRLATDWRRELMERVQHRHLVVGEVGKSPLLDIRQWVIGIIVPVVYTIIVIPIPITYAKTPNVYDGSMTLRLVDLESGSVQSEYFELFFDEPGVSVVSRDSVTFATPLLLDPQAPR